MMKNSKLSKLLVAGVSVAMLASALAPMAFAEEGSNLEAKKDLGLEVSVRVFDQATGDALTLIDENGNDATQIDTFYGADAVKTIDGATVIGYTFDENTIDFDNFTLKDSAKYEKVDRTESYLYIASARKYEWDTNLTSFSVQDLFDKVGTTSTGVVSDLTDSTASSNSAYTETSRV